MAFVLEDRPGALWWEALHLLSILPLVYWWNDLGLLTGDWTGLALPALAASFFLVFLVFLASLDMRPKTVTT